MTETEIKLIIPTECFFKAADILNGNALKLWVYIMSNKDGYKFGLSPTDAYNKMGLDRKGYYRAVKELQDKGYMIKITSGEYVVQSQRVEKTVVEDNYPEQVERQTLDRGQNDLIEALGAKFITDWGDGDKMSFYTEGEMTPDDGQNDSVGTVKMPREIEKDIEYREDNKDGTAHIEEPLRSGETGYVHEETKKRQSESFWLWSPPSRTIAEEENIIYVDVDENGNIIYDESENVRASWFDEDELPF